MPFRLIDFKSKKQFEFHNKIADLSKQANEQAIRTDKLLSAARRDEAKDALNAIRNAIDAAVYALFDISSAEIAIIERDL